MITLDEQIQRIKLQYNEIFYVARDKIEIPLYPKASVLVDFSKYPKKPSFSLPKPLLKLIPDFEVLLPRYKGWNKQNPPVTVELIIQLKQSIDILSGSKAYVSEDLLKVLFNVSQSNLPNEIFTLLRLSEGKFVEYVLAPGSEASETSAVFFPQRLSHDNTLCGTCHSHPSGNFHPSMADLQTFRQKMINIILAKPFTYQSIGVYNHLGEPIPFEIQ